MLKKWLFVLTLGLYSHTLFAAEKAQPNETQDLDLAKLIRPLTYPVLGQDAPAGSLQERLQQVSKVIDGYCQKPSAETQDEREWICLWPKVVKEFDTVATSLAITSPDRNRLLMTLAAGLHPSDMLTEFTTDQDNHSLMVSRYLIALRLMVYQWKSVRPLLGNLRQHSPLDHFMEAWLLAENPWQFVKMVKKEEWLSAAADLVADDQSLSRLEPPTNPVHDTHLVAEHMEDLVASVLYNKKAYLFLTPDYSDLAGEARQVREYLTHLEEDQNYFPSSLPPSKSLCEDLKALKKISTTQRLPWSTALSEVPEDCNSTSFRAIAAAKIAESGMLLRFNMYHLRTSLISFYLVNRDLDEAKLRTVQYERSLRSILTEIEFQKSKPKPFIRRERTTEMKSAAKLLLNYFYDVAEGLGPL